MTKSNNRNGRASGLKNRQLNNINKSISAPQPEAQPRKSLVDRMTFTNQPQQMLPVKESGKRKRGETADTDSAQQKKKHRVSPACEAPIARDTTPARDMPTVCAEATDMKDEISQSPVVKDTCKVATGETARTPNNPRSNNKPSNNVKRNGVISQKVMSSNEGSDSKADMTNATAEIEAKAMTPAQEHHKTEHPIMNLPNDNVAVAPKTPFEVAQMIIMKTPSMSVDVAKDGVVKASSSFPSPPPSNDNSPTTKRPIFAMEVEPTKDARKKQCLTDARLPTEETTQDELQLINDKLFTFFKKSAHAGAPVVANPDCVPEYAEYDDDSVPILHSALIERRDSPVLFNNPSVEVKAKAYILLERPRGFTPEDMGRDPKIAKIGRAKIINDVDLYAMTDGKIYVATERGLLLTADYLKLAGIPETTGVRFKDLKPAWVKASAAKRFTKKVCTTTEDPDAPEQENSWPPIPEGDLGLYKGAPVQVYEQHPTNGRAFGRRIDNDKLGWFDYKNLTDLNAPFPGWEGLWTSDIMQLVHADPEYDLPLSGKSISPPKSATRLSATPPVPSTKTPVAVKSATAKAKSQSPEVPKPKSDNAVIESVVKATDRKSEAGATHKTQKNKAEVSPLTVRAEASVQPASGANKDGKEAEIKPEIATAVQASGPNNDMKANTQQDDTTSVQLVGVSKEGGEIKANPEYGVVGKATEPKIVESPKPRKQLPLEPRALHDRSVEDDVDWDDDEL
jgi:hypothetical protein